LREKGLDAGNNIQRRCISRFLNRQQYRPLPVHAHDIGLWGKSVAYPGDILDIDGGVANRLDRDAIQVRNRLRGCVGDRNIVFLGPDFGRSSWQDQVLNADGIHYIQCGQSLRLQRCGIQVHLHLALFTAVWIRYGCARHRNDLRPNEIQAIVIELLFRKILA
jgi:hypothetical protein